MAVKERGNDVVFLRRVIPGGADKSYGIHVAKLAGLPGKVIERSQELLVQIETEATCQTPRREKTSAAAPMGSLFQSSLADELASLDTLTLTPLEALNILHKLTVQAKQEAGKL